MTFCIVDYGIGNTGSIQNAFERLGLDRPVVSNDIDKLSTASALLLPGVGAFASCMDKLASSGLREELTTIVVDKEKPILGICVGMQMLADTSTEGGTKSGLGWIPGEVVRLNNAETYPVPHVGWNDVNSKKNCPIYTNVDDLAHFYFDHSYHFVCDEKYVSASVDYGQSLVASVQKDNIFGVQFHPEKSGNAGLKLFRSFVRYVEQC